MNNCLVAFVETLGVPLACVKPLAVGNGDLAAISNLDGVEYLFISTDSEHSAKILKQALENSSSTSLAAAISTDGTISAIYRKSFAKGDIEAVVGPNASRLVKPPKTREALAGIDSWNRDSELTDNFESVLYDLHSALRDIDGLHAPEALDEICKLLLAKAFDEHGDPQNTVFSISRYGSVDECAASIRQAYCNALNRKDKPDEAGNEIDLAGLNKDPLRLSSHAIHKSLSIIERYNFTKSELDAKGRAFQKVLSAVMRSGMGQYFTPKPVIDLIVDLVAPQIGERMIDPFCGSAHFLSSSLNYTIGTGSGSSTQRTQAAKNMFGIEKSDRMHRIAVTELSLIENAPCRILNADALASFDVLDYALSDSFDIVLTNPPFGVDLPMAAIETIGPFEILQDKAGKGKSVSLEILAIDRCLTLLRPGGRLAIVLPDGILSNRNAKYVRKWLEKVANVRAIISLPIETFTPYGANIKTSVLLLSKPHAGAKPGSDARVFLAEIESVGYDASGRPKDCDDFGLLKNQFREFIRNEGW